jgi:hypothetical protein
LHFELRWHVNFGADHVGEEAALLCPAVVLVASSTEAHKVVEEKRAGIGGSIYRVADPMDEVSLKEKWAFPRELLSVG